MKMIHYLVLGLALSGTGVLLWKTPKAFRQPTAAEAQRIKKEGLVRDYYREDIDRAKEESKKEIILPAAVLLPSSVTSVEEVIRDYSLLRVKVIDKETTVSEPADIKTWYKLEVVETLNQQAQIVDRPLPDGIPSRFLPLLPSEALRVVQGGSITVDGVQVVRALSRDEPPFNTDEEYLIAAYLDYGGKFIVPISRAAGIFRIEGSSLKPLGPKNLKLVGEVEEIYGNDLNRVRSDVRLRQFREK